MPSGMAADVPSFAAGDVSSATVMPVMRALKDAVRKS